MSFNYNKIIQLIDESGIPRKSFFSKVGITEKKFREWVSGAVPREDTLKSIAKQLNVQLSDLRDAVINTSAEQSDNSSAKDTTTLRSALPSNFTFLSSDYESLYTHATTAEQLYLSGFYTQCVIQLGILAESITEQIVLYLDFYDDYLDFTHHERLDVLCEGKYIPLKWYDIFTDLRKARNNAMHEHACYGKDEALTFLRKTYDLSRWFGHTVKIDVPSIPFVELSESQSANIADDKPLIQDKAFNCSCNEDIEANDANEDVATNGVTEQPPEFLFTDLPDGGLSIRAYIGGSTIVDIPEEYQGKKILEIGDRAFQNCSTMEVVKLPESVICIRNNAFAWCENLQKVQGPHFIKDLGMRAFFRCKNLKNIDITFSFIGKEAFAGCTSLSSYDFGSKLIGIAKFAFAECTSLTELIANDGICVIGDCAFYNCSALSIVVISDSIVSVGEDAFSNCSNIKTLYIPAHIATADKIASALKTSDAKTESHNFNTHSVTPSASSKASDQHSSEKTLVEYLEYCGVKVIDKRYNKGNLWAVGTEEEIGDIIEEAQRIFGVKGYFCSGSKSTGYRTGWYTSSPTTEKKPISISIDYDEVTTAGKLYEKYFGKIDELLIIEDVKWTNEYCFVVEQLSEDGQKLMGTCYCNGIYQKHTSYPISRKFRVFNGRSKSQITRIHSK